MGEDENEEGEESDAREESSEEEESKGESGVMRTPHEVSYYTIGQNSNDDADEDKLAILLSNGTQVLKIKSLERTIKSKDQESETLRAQQQSLQDEVEKFRALGLESIDTADPANWMD